MIFITGDTHRNFKHIVSFCKKFNTSKKDVLLILGDAGINYCENQEDDIIKEGLQKLPITLFCIHGNHEARPESISTYELAYFHEGKVYVEEHYPNILFAKDGEIYNLDGKKTIVIGGAYSVDKYYRLKNHWRWWKDEQPSEYTKSFVENKLLANDWNVDVVLSHTTPSKYEPVETFLPMIDQSAVDKSTELWLDEIEDRLEYKKWYCGHYHIDKSIDKIRFLYNTIEEFK